MEYRYPSIFFENMWKYVSRRFRDTLERGANDFGRCSSTLVNNGGVNCEEKTEVAPGPPWLSLRKTKSSQNDNGTNAPKWGFEHRDRNWMGAITWQDNGYNKLHESNEKNAGPPCKWFFNKGSELEHSENRTNDMKWPFDHQDETWINANPWRNGFNKTNDKNEQNSKPPSKWLSLQQCPSQNGENSQEWSIERRERTWMNGKPWGHCMKKRFGHAERKAGPPCKFRSFRRSKSLDNDKWGAQHQHGACMEAKSDTCVNKYNDESNGKQHSMWISLRKYCKSYHKDDGTNGKKWNFQHLNKTWMDAITWSGVAVLGWYTSQLIHLKLKQHCRVHETKCLPVNTLITSIYPYLTDMNKSDFYVDSISKIGKVLTDFTPTVYLMANDQSGSLKVKDNVAGNFLNNVSEHVTSSVSENLTSNVSEHITSNASKHVASNVSKHVTSNVSKHVTSNASEHSSVNTSGNRSGNSAQTHPHSPTIPQSIDTSDDDLGGVLNSIENRLGLASIENGQYQDGLSLLRSAAERNHAPAIYNLGLCYEKGLGVTANEKTAMELYKSAAALDHPEALYNLGIFYGQGRGGLKADQETAVRLLRLAAVQGQKDAIDALKYLDVSISEPRHQDVNSWNYEDHTQFSLNQNIVPTQSKLFIDNINFLQARV
ncbi:hypothetical protein PYW08_008674 [Mythimna loreyi]|uniref:Uncharacterized protein n=1 Tax=Mythimna loreyi TaxID=667449 RepID=A0ACC2QBT9_9NEOP|nr:hypothetical protein PYW08_008674 [Mythimna loreyi]